MLPRFAWVRPDSLKEAAKAAAEGGARLHAGGTDLIGCLHDGVLGADTLVSLSGLPDLVGLREGRDGRLRIGAMTTLSALASSDLVRGRHPVLAEAAASVGSPQLRNQGTIGGNLCQKPRCWYYRGDFPCLRKGGDVCYAEEGESRYHGIFGGSGCHMVHPSDTAHALVALDASLRIVGPAGEREVPVERFHVPPSVDFTRETVLEPGEIVAEVLVPRAPPGTLSRYRKVRVRQAWDFALVGAAVALTVQGGNVRRARVVLAGVAPLPWRARKAEAVLTGAALTDEIVARAADAAVEGASPLAHNGYKVALTRGALEEALGALRR